MGSSPNYGVTFGVLCIGVPLSMRVCNYVYIYIYRERESVCVCHKDDNLWILLPTIPPPRRVEGCFGTPRRGEANSMVV